MSRDIERRELSSKRMKAGHYRPASETPFKWRFAGGPMVARNCILSWQGGLLKRTTANNVQNIRPVQNLHRSRIFYIFYGSNSNMELSFCVHLRK